VTATVILVSCFDVFDESGAFDVFDGVVDSVFSFSSSVDVVNSMTLFGSSVDVVDSMTLFGSSVDVVDSMTLFGSSVVSLYLIGLRFFIFVLM